ncbi:MAG TPA: dipeptidase PepE [Pyrinomonadaceae bacterium]|jgi:dipeptidase E|nr:dipeptidase PepE [Pyrinomonadaceae bacterium]
MSKKRLLLVSNGAEIMLQPTETTSQAIRDFLGREVKNIFFVPFANVVRSFDDYASAVRARFGALGYDVQSAHEAADPLAALGNADAIVVGGGNTFHLLRGLYEAGLMEAIRERVESGVPYLGWSAGSNVACPSIKTTNDMPVVEPPSLDALRLVPFQINPHYTDAHPPGHHGETRDERIAEFVHVNPGTYVVGLREGSMLRIEGTRINLLGDKTARIFVNGKLPAEVGPGESLQFLFS